MKNIVKLIKITIKEFNRDNTFQMAAALAYYMLFAIPSILLISINLLRIFLEDTQVKMTILYQVKMLTGQTTVNILNLVIDHLHQYAYQGNIIQWIGIITLIASAMSAIGHLQTSLNTIWDLAPHPSRSTMNSLKTRLSRLFILFIIGCIILFSFVVDILMKKFNIYLAYYFGEVPFIFDFIDSLISFITVLCSIALLFKLIPEGHMSWIDIIFGSLVTTILFILGKYVVTIIISHNAFGTIYGAAGSLIVLLVWIYYLSLIFFFGAEFTQVYSNLHGHGIRLKQDTIRKY